jgi:hypothetical protein
MYASVAGKRPAILRLYPIVSFGFSICASRLPMLGRCRLSAGRLRLFVEKRFQTLLSISTCAATSCASEAYAALQEGH